MASGVSTLLIRYQMAMVICVDRHQPFLREGDRPDLEGHFIAVIASHGLYGLFPTMDSFMHTETFLDHYVPQRFVQVDSTFC